MHQSSFIELGQSNPDFGRWTALPAVAPYCNSSNYPDQYTCYGYLSMLAKYIAVTKDMTEAEIKLYFVRAEYRYFRYVNRGYSSYNITCPLDIAILMQEHKASSNTCEDDCDREFGCRSDLVQISNFDTIVELHNKNMFPDYWKEMMGSTEPPHLTKDNIFSSSQKGYAELTCIVCYIDLQVKWQDFAEWRLDHKVALCCHRCNSRFTMDHVGKANLITDLYKSKLYRDSQHTKAIIGKTHTKVMKYVKSIHDLKTLPFDSGLDAIRDHLDKSQKEAGIKDDGSIDEFIEAAKSTYFGSPYICSSSDLIKELVSNYAFHYKVTQILKWTAQDFSKMPLDYLHFARLNEAAAKKRDFILVPTYKTEIARRTHMVWTKQYRVENHKYVNAKIAGINNTVIPQDQEDRYIQITKCEWDVLKAKRSQYDTTLAIKKAFQQYKIDFSALRQKIALIAKSARLYDKYDVAEAYISKPDSYKDFENLKPMSQYLTSRSLNRSASDWSTFDSRKVVPTTGSKLKLMEGRSLELPYYPYTFEDSKFNWYDANVAWSKAFVDVKDFQSIKSRWYFSKATIGSPMIFDAIDITFNEALAIAERNRVLAEEKRAAVLARKQREAKQRYQRSSNGGGGGGGDGGYHYGSYSGYNYDSGGYSYDGGGYCGDSGGYGGDSGGCSGGDSGGGGGGDGGGGGGGGGGD
ncbi:hypothetical protein MAM1_0079d04458 [Mucor ambiguus]|uniref:Uncharacterized protein n=1 Tax=Mucor ambiguus TaxID=91626 RepID=A0A0C9LUG6_9FUNG|nr:hypothetical protein MAM1_0079d04458 [Mucor ambiguus]